MLGLALGDVDSAEQQARRALAFAKEIGIAWLSGHAHRLLGRVAARGGDPPEEPVRVPREPGDPDLLGEGEGAASLLLRAVHVAEREAEHGEVLERDRGAVAVVRPLVDRERPLEGREGEGRLAPEPVVDAEVVERERVALGAPHALVDLDRGLVEADVLLRVAAEVAVGAELREREDDPERVAGAAPEHGPALQVRDRVVEGPLEVLLDAHVLEEGAPGRVGALRELEGLAEELRGARVAPAVVLGGREDVEGDELLPCPLERLPEVECLGRELDRLEVVAAPEADPRHALEDLGALASQRGAVADPLEGGLEPLGRGRVVAAL